MRTSKPIDFDSLPDTAYVRLNQLVPDVIPISKSGVWERVRQNRFPKPTKFSVNVTCWNVGSIRAWMKNPNQEYA